MRFSAPVVVVERVGEMVGAPGGPPPSPAHFGPDLCRPDVDLDLALARMASIPEPDATIAEVLLDQPVAAGIGNVDTSEVLWACRVDPFAPVAAVDDAPRRRLLERARSTYWCPRCQPAADA